jgi:hypothetical protein
MKKNDILTAVVVLGGAALGASPAQALVSWNFSSTATPYGCVSADPSGCAGWNTTATYSGTSDNSNDPAANVVVRAFQNRADVNNTDPTSYTGNTYLQQTATNDFAGGLGAAPDIVNQDGIIDRDGWSPSTSSEGSDPYHTIENYGYNSEFVLFDFGKLTTLSQVSIGYIPNGWDSDMTVLAYTADGGGVDKQFANLDLSNLTFNTMDEKGWQVVGNYGNVGTGPEAINGGGHSSRWWAIGAYNPAFGTTSANGGGLGTGSCASPCTSTAWDGFKLATASGNYKHNGGGGGQPVPTPGVVGLIGLGLALMGWQKRRFAA